MMRKRSDPTVYLRTLNRGPSSGRGESDGTLMQVVRQATPGPVYVDDLVSRLGLSSSQVLSALREAEGLGYVTWSTDEKGRQQVSATQAGSRFVAVRDYF